jgi:hypothetical protein
LTAHRRRHPDNFDPTPAGAGPVLQLGHINESTKVGADTDILEKARLLEHQRPRDTQAWSAQSTGAASSARRDRS